MLPILRPALISPFHSFSTLFHLISGHSDKTKEHISPGVQHPGSTGVIYVTERAVSSTSLQSLLLLFF